MIKTVITCDSAECTTKVELPTRINTAPRIPTEWHYVGGYWICPACVAKAAAFLQINTTTESTTAPTPVTDPADVDPPASNDTTSSQPPPPPPPANEPT